ncbi:YrzQ family protein [Bacillaceae bacterium CLA-AA-H227]|uniref:YrzQ family protein n=1 Tax=Robertmurraya yapensis (ex Hitch et al 2024) TaxID=3133160 RepID=A0ACC6S8I5_9BACI
MNKALVSTIAFGAGMVAYRYAQKNDLLSRQGMKKIQRKAKAIF